MILFNRNAACYMANVVTTTLHLMSILSRNAPGCDTILMEYKCRKPAIQKLRCQRKAGITLDVYCIYMYMYISLSYSA